MFMDGNNVAIGNIEEVNVLLYVGHVHHADMEMFFYSMRYAQQYLCWIVCVKEIKKNHKFLLVLFFMYIFESTNLIH